MKSNKIVALVVTAFSLSSLFIFNSNTIYATSNTTKSIQSSYIAPTKTSTVSGVIRDSKDNSSISGGEIIFEGNGKTYTALSNSKGLYKISLPFGEYKISANSTYYDSYASVININSKKTDNINIKLTKSDSVQSVSGKVTDKSTGSPISGANVVYTNDKKTYTAKTNASGIYTINVPPSQYTVTTTATSYKSNTNKITIENNKMLKKIDIQLEATKTDTNVAISIITEKTSYPVNTESINVIIKNNSSENNGYGLNYNIEYFNTSSWVKVPVGAIVPVPFVMLKPGESRIQNFSLYQDEYNYKPGKYRIIVSGQYIAEFTLTADTSSSTQVGSVTMKAAQNSYPVNSESIKVTISNGTKKESGYGYDYRIEYFNGKSWQKIPLNFAVIEIYLVLKPGETKTETISLYQSQYKYIPGKYRVVKTVGTKRENSRIYT